MILGYPSSNANGVIVSLTEYALQNSPPLDVAGDVFEMTLSLASQGTGNAPVTLAVYGTMQGEFTIESSLLTRRRTTRCWPAAPETSTRTTPRVPHMGFPGTFLYFRRRQRVERSNNDTMTLFITQQ